MIVEFSSSALSLITLIVSSEIIGDHLPSNERGGVMCHTVLLVLVVVQLIHHYREHFLGLLVQVGNGNLRMSRLVEVLHEQQEGRSRDDALSSTLQSRLQGCRAQ